MTGQEPLCLYTLFSAPARLASLAFPRLVSMPNYNLRYSDNLGCLITEMTTSAGTQN